MESPDETRERRRPVGVSHLLKVGVALLVLVAAGRMLLQSPLPEVDARGTLAEHFRLQELPFDFAVAQAHELVSGEVVVALESGDARAADVTHGELGIELESEEPQDAVAELVEDDESELPDTSEDAADAVRLTAAEIAAKRERHAHEDGTPPSELYLVRYPRERSKDVLAKQLARHSEEKGGESRGDEDEDGDEEDESHEDWQLTIEAGRVPWGAFDADYVLEREYLEDDHFQDVVRVNLTRNQQCWVLFAVWPRDYRGSLEPIQQLLSALLPL